MLSRANRMLAMAALCCAVTVACGREDEPPPATSQAVNTPPPAKAETTAGEKQTQRQVIRKAQLRLEVSSVGSAHARAIALAEGFGGHVAQASHNTFLQHADPSLETSSLTLRVPSEKLSLLLVELRKLARGDVSEQIGSEDVSDEVVDLEARLRNQRRLEEQLAGLLKTATTIESALRVHQELATARGEIERLEGRRQFLERETSFASVEVTFSERPEPKVSSGAIGDSISRAGHDALTVGSGIIVSGIRLIGVLIPIALLIFLPALLAILLARKVYLWRTRQAAQV